MLSCNNEHATHVSAWLSPMPACPAMPMASLDPIDYHGCAEGEYSEEFYCRQGAGGLNESVSVK